MYDRNSAVDAQLLFEKLVPDAHMRAKLAEFLLESAHRAELAKPGNWNINLDPYGRFVRLTVGCLYCIEINKKELFILCDRATLNQEAMISGYYNMVFFGYIRKERVQSNNINQLPDCLVKAPGSIGCIVSISNIDSLRESNHAFIKVASRTHQFKRNRNAHSPGMIKYLESISVRTASSHSFDQKTPFYLNQILAQQDARVAQSARLSHEERMARLNRAARRPMKKQAMVSVFDRNADVIVEVLQRAGGYCERCGHHAPFLKDSDGSPYLEVHHKTPLAEEGDDTIDNAIALCPNCHRHAHYGKQTFTYTDQ